MTPLTLQEAKDTVAREKYGYPDFKCYWFELVNQDTAECDGIELLAFLDEAALLHSLSCQEALREKIASEAGFTFIFPGGIPSIDREAIRNTPLIEG